MERDVSSSFFSEVHRRQLEEINRAIINFRNGREEAINQILSEILVVQPIQVPEDFWEPVKVTIKDTEGVFKFTDEEWECLICREERTKKTKLHCCGQEICDSCVDNWFNKESVKCPFCKRDIRDLNSDDNSS